MGVVWGLILGYFKGWRLPFIHWIFLGGVAAEDIPKILAQEGKPHYVCRCNKQTNSATKPAMQAKIPEIITNKICNEERSWAQNILREMKQYFYHSWDYEHLPIVRSSLCYRVSVYTQPQTGPSGVQKHIHFFQKLLFHFKRSSKMFGLSHCRINWPRASRRCHLRPFLHLLNGKGAQNEPKMRKFSISCRNMV